MPNKRATTVTKLRAVEAMLEAILDEVRFGLEGLDAPEYDPVYALHSIRRIGNFAAEKIRSVAAKMGSKNDGYFPLKGQPRKRGA